MDATISTKRRRPGWNPAWTLFLLLLVMASAAEPAWAQKMKNYAKSLAKQCYPEERVLDSTESVLLGKDKVTTGAKVFLTNRIEMHFIMHSEKGSETLYELVIDDAQCIEKGVKGPCSCPAIIIGKTAQPDNASSSNAGFTRDDETPKKKAVKKIGNKQLKNYIGKTVCIEMKDGAVHENAVITDIRGNQVFITEFKYGGRISYEASLNDVEQVTAE